MEAIDALHLQALDFSCARSSRYYVGLTSLPSLHTPLMGLAQRHPPSPRHHRVPQTLIGGHRTWSR